jgi:hypothetical protein
MWRLIPKARPCSPHRPTVSPHARRAVRAATAAASQQVTGSLCGHGPSSSLSPPAPLPRAAAAPDPDSSGDVSSSSALPLPLPSSVAVAGRGRQVSSRHSRSAPPDAAHAAAAAATTAGIAGWGGEQPKRTGGGGAPRGSRRASGCGRGGCGKDLGEGEGDREGGREALKLKRGRRGGENGERSSVSRFYFARGRLVKFANLASEPAGTGRLCFVSDGKKTNSIGFLRARLL